MAEAGNLPIWLHFSGVMRALSRLDLGEPGARDELVGHAGRLYADPEFTSVPWLQVWTVLGRADVEVRGGDAERAARLLGLVERLEVAARSLDPEQEARRRSVGEALTSSLGAERLDALLAEGRALRSEAAIRLVAGD